MCLVTAIKFYVYKEEPYYVAQCINVDVSSFGQSIEEAIANLKEAVALYLEDPSGHATYRAADDLVLGEALIGA
jgi:predicted RNase H-like HicB family nuclease